MALNGINLPLAFTGQEGIWQRVYHSLGLSQSDIDEYLTGPAFLAWLDFTNIMKNLEFYDFPYFKILERLNSNIKLIRRWRMGNLQKWGGTISQSYISKKLQLLHWITKRMRNLGMIPVLPAFAGNVPQALTKLFPNSTFQQHPSWARFNSTYSE